MPPGKLATPTHYDALLAKLSQEGEVALAALNFSRAEDWAAYVAMESHQAIEQFTFDGVAYSLRLTGFAVVQHGTDGAVIERIGYFPDHDDQQVRLGVSERHMRTCYVKLG